jgi:hypothetical protein
MKQSDEYSKVPSSLRNTAIVVCVLIIVAFFLLAHFPLIRWLIYIGAVAALVLAARAFYFRAK